MGDHLLMKTLLLLIFISISLSADANTDWVDGQVAAIKPPRQGVSPKDIERVKNPFLITYKSSVGKKSPATGKKKRSKSTTKKSNRSLRLQAIMNGSALIDGKWYKVDEKVRGYQIDKVSDASVVLKRGKERKELLLSSNDPKIKIQIK